MSKKAKMTKWILWGVLALAVLGCALWLALPRGGRAACPAGSGIAGALARAAHRPQAADEEIPLEAYDKEVLLEIRDHRICFQHSDCPDKICIHNGWLGREGEQAVCLPNRVSVILTDGSTVPVTLE